ncbi:DgyrCDS3190 [Dimorphilus gyrociliatus]|uniref:DgyrCDS3190 n=1 Tax=Dimorphilus gyrociliatus TaxID=2664684 RepID=A0A7I8VF79_9ANNE|nr:DgyrCDS3190 [Dimorphilus gyrociliatus]
MENSTGSYVRVNQVSYPNGEIETEQLLSSSHQVFLVCAIQTIGERDLLLIYVTIPQRQTCLQRLFHVRLLRRNDDITQIIRRCIYPIYNKIIGYTILGSTHFKAIDHLPYVDIIMKLPSAFYSDIMSIPSLRLNDLYTHLEKKWDIKRPKYFKGDKLFIKTFADYINEACKYPDEFLKRWECKNRSTIGIIKEVSNEYSKILDSNQLQYLIENIDNIRSKFPNKMFEMCYSALEEDFSALAELCDKNPWIPFGVRLMPLCNVEHLFSLQMSEEDRELLTFIKFKYGA